MPTLEKGFVAQSFRLDGRVALINGGRGEMAVAMGAALADLGCSVVFMSRKVEECEAVANDIGSCFGVRTLGLRCDVSNEAEIEAAVARVVEELGQIDILINNAGASWWGLPEDIPLSGWQKVMDVNVTGTFLACRHVARHMIARGQGGSIINIASVGAYLSYTPEKGQVVPYTTSKAAVVHLTSNLAAQWSSHGIRVNAIAPGSIETGMTKTVPEDQKAKLLDGILLRRFGKPVELTGTVALLASDAGGFITGQTYIVDGGQTIA